MPTADTKRPATPDLSLVVRWCGALLLAAAAVGLGSLAGAAEEQPAETRSAGDLKAQKQALAELNELIGAWRGVGMPRRGSRVGAWSEQAEWVWRFDENSVAVDYKIDEGKQLETARITYDPARKVYHLAGAFADETRREYEGRIKEGKLTFESPPGDDGYVHRITVRTVNEKRALVLYQKRRENSRLLSRVAEVGYTRAGTSLAVEGAGEIKCIVTGGKGTIPVKYQGKTYYVCCSGCKIAFDDDPAGVIAEYQARLAERKKEQARND